MVGFAATSLLLGILLTAPQSDSPRPLRFPVGESGDVNLSEVVRKLADDVGAKIEAPTRELNMPVAGIAGALTRALLTESLGTDASVTVRPRELVIEWTDAAKDAPSLTRLRGRVEELARQTKREAARRSHYGMRALPSYKPNDPARPTICLVHGMNSSLGGFMHMIAPLEEAGFGVVAYEFPYDQDLDITAPAFAKDWIAFRKKVGETRPWAILGHSMGGLLARWYVEGPTYAGDVSHLLLIAPPNQGAAVARAQTLMQLIEGLKAVNGKKAGALSRLSDGLGAAADDMLPGSAFLKALNGRPRREGVRYHILAGDSGFVSAAARTRAETQLQLFSKGSGLLGGLTRLAAGDVRAQLDELTDGTGDGCVSVASTRLEGVADHEVIHANHVELIRGPMLYPDPGPVACMPWVLKRTKALRDAAKAAAARR